MIKKILVLLSFATTLGLAACGDDQANADHAVTAEVINGQVCADFGPQTPRDIDNRPGENAMTFAKAPPAAALNLCNIHFHENAEHKAAAFSDFGGEGDHAGYQCGIAKTLTAAEKAPHPAVCGDIQPGDTIEVHWVHSSCDVQPGPGLGSCLTDSCEDPKLRVETQVFTVVNDPNALNFDNFRYTGDKTNGFHQAKSLPSGTGKPVEFLGSTTGPKYTEQSCSPLKVNWSVRPLCAKVHIGSLEKFCADNVFDEDHAHGVRKLVTNPKLLSPIN